MKPIQFFFLILLIAAVPVPVIASPPVSTTGGLTSSDQCGVCHKDIYSMWRNSAHSSSMDGEVFLEAYRATEASEGTSVSRRCLSCHAPAVQVNRDYELQQRVTWEGVSCDICHSLVSVDLSGLGPRMNLDIGRIKRGPIRDASSTGHQVAFSELHTSSLACAPCHEYLSPDGVPIITTFTEWKDSRSASRGESCQSCHMGLARADVVDPKIKRVRNGHVNMHLVPGGHSLEQLHKALGVSLDLARDANTVTLDVVLENKGAGHAIPTGMPGRRILLDVEIRSSLGQRFEEQKIYTRTFADRSGQTIEKDGGYFVPGVKSVSDTRILADETRTESFRFDIPRKARVFLDVRLHYVHEPTGGKENRTWITFQSLARMMQPES